MDNTHRSSLPLSLLSTSSNPCLVSSDAERTLNQIFPFLSPVKATKKNNQFELHYYESAKEMTLFSLFDRSSSSSVVLSVDFVKSICVSLFVALDTIVNNKLPCSSLSENHIYINSYNEIRFGLFFFYFSLFFCD